MTDPIIFGDVTIQESGVIPLPFGIQLNAMTDPEQKTCTFQLTSFAATEPEARNNLNTFLEALIKSITPTTKENDGEEKEDRER